MDAPSPCEEAPPFKRLKQRDRLAAALEESEAEEESNDDSEVEVGLGVDDDEVNDDKPRSLAAIVDVAGFKCVSCYYEPPILHGTPMHCNVR